jgi:hypothetical protein
VRATWGGPDTRTDVCGGCRQKDVSEVLQIERVYKNVEKGEFAKAKDLLKAFGTDDQVSRTPTRAAMLAPHPRLHPQPTPAARSTPPADSSTARLWVKV